MALVERLELSTYQWEKMRAHVEACKPLEGCGLLAGREGLVTRVLPVRNAAQSPSRFRMDPAGQVSAFREMEDLGLELLGIFHSHPAGKPVGTSALAGPSETDIREAAYPAVQVIWTRSSGQWEARGFWIEQGSVREVPLVIDAAQ
jgi:proteasome lid subunit RPN8/RPN11